jgi:phosphatidylserine/phosphatidylglycerophosphate/cardiolipin synthase-like enzyme
MFKRFFWLLVTAVIPTLFLSLLTTIPHLTAAENASTILIDAVLYDGLEGSDVDEAVRLRNVSTTTVDIGGWRVNDYITHTTTAAFPSGTMLTSGQSIWVTKNGAAFTRQFGFLPDFEATNSNTAIPNLSNTTWPGFSNTGDEVYLQDDAGDVVDVLVYEGGAVTSQWSGEWSGTAVYPYKGGTSFAVDGQILYRRRDQTTGLPVPDTNTAADWAQGTDDVINGRKTRYPGWDLDTFFMTAQVTETAVLTIAIAPDNAYQAIINEINRATTSLDIETHTFENLAIKDALVQAANRGVAINILLEGGPPGGIPDQEKYICQELEAADAHCWLMFNDSDNKIYDRYDYIHAKFILIDGQKVIISSENLSPNSLPDDDKSDGTWGRRGVVLITDAPGVVSHVQQIFDLDLDPANHVDITSTVGIPPIDFVPIAETGGVTYTVRYPDPVAFSGQFAFELVQSPENSLRDQDGLLGLVNQAGAGDTVLVQQLSERPYWGASSSNPTADPNPRLEAYIDAARRGAKVRLLLDEYFDDGGTTSNSATCDYVKTIAQNEGLDLDCALGNPAGLGIHNKMVLVEVNGRGFIHIGSINGTETSNKANRELALQVQSDDAYALLADMFNRDWPYRVYLPVILNNFIGSAGHLLISEVLYDSPGLDNAEFIELVNPTGSTIDLSNFSLGDAVNPTDFEDVRRFPAGTMLVPRTALVIATTATGFFAEFGKNPDFEILNTDPAVSSLIDDPNWGSTNTYLQLGNAGDEIILRDANDQVVDVVTYGSGSYPGVTTCPLITLLNASLERSPFWRDTDDCTVDFFENAFPTPGTLVE